MGKKSGFSLIEVLVAFVILALVVGGSIAAYVSIKQLAKEVVGYRYTALNLAREMMEAGETGFVPTVGGFIHPFRLKYYYAPAAGNSLSQVFLSSGQPCAASDSRVDGFINDVTGYGLKEWRCFCVKEKGCNVAPSGYTHPFTYLGDIKAKGLVPKDAQDNVIISYYVEPAEDALVPGNSARADNEKVYGQRVEVEWEEGGQAKKEVLAGIPIRKLNTNDRLNTATFSW